MPNYDDMGDLDILSGDDDMGALIRRNNRGMTIRRQPPIISRIPGAPPTSQKDVPLGFGSVVPAAAAATQAVTLTARPQLPFRGRRLVINVLRSAAGAAVAVDLTAILVGSRNQLASSQSVPAEIFQPNATNVSLELDPASPGLDVTLQFSVGPVAVAGDVVIQAGMVGDSIG